MPIAVRGAISVSIGLFISYIGFQSAGIIVTNGFTQILLVDFANWGEQLVNWGKDPFEASKTAIIAFIGLFIIAVLDLLFRSYDHLKAFFL